MIIVRHFLDGFNEFTGRSFALNDIEAHRQLVKMNNIQFSMGKYFSTSEKSKHVNRRLSILPDYNKF